MFVNYAEPIAPVCRNHVFASKKRQKKQSESATRPGDAKKRAPEPNLVDFWPFWAPRGRPGAAQKAKKAVPETTQKTDDFEGLRPKRKRSPKDHPSIHTSD